MSPLARPHLSCLLATWLTPASRRWARVCWLCLAGSLLASAGDPLPGAAGDPKPPTLNEIEVTTRVRQALAKDPEMQKLTLFIKVQAGRATLSGPVPSIELARKVEKVVREVRGIYEVVSRLQISPEEQAIPIPLQQGQPVQSESARPIEQHNPGSDGGHVGGVDSLPPQTAGNDSATMSNSLVKRADPSTSAVQLLPPVSDASARTTAVSGAPQAGPAPPSANDPTANVRAWINWICGDDARYRAIRIEIRDAQTLCVYDDPYHGDAVAALVAQLRRIPGVRTVLLKTAYPR